MAYHPPALLALIDHFNMLPGVGRKTATRMALHVLRLPDNKVKALADSLIEVKERIKFCSVCHNYTDADPCKLCSDEARSTGVVCVVEGPGDLLAIETTGAFSGRYHVLGGLLAPLSGVGPDDLRINELLARLEPEGIREVLIALPGSTEGEATASYIGGKLKAKGIRTTKVAQGVPLGAELEFVDAATLKKAVQERRET